MKGAVTVFNLVGGSCCVQPTSKGGQLCSDLGEGRQVVAKSSGEMWIGPGQHPLCLYFLRKPSMKKFSCLIVQTTEPIFILFSIGKSYKNYFDTPWG